jgi:DNA-binding CsgD family transcriptional regulator
MGLAEGYAQAAIGAGLLRLMLDEVDYGMVLLDAQVEVLHANHAARAECEATHPLQLLGRRLQARQPAHEALLQEALADARRGRRALLSLGDAGRPVNVAVVPVGGDGELRATLLMMGKRHICGQLAVDGFARCHALTPAETRVLAGLCEGLHPREVARRHGVSLATVRSQIRSLRAKTGAGSIRDLVRQVSVLPPMLNCLRTPA